jgi:hypothetical protein
VTHKRIGGFLRYLAHRNGEDHPGKEKHETLNRGRGRPYCGASGRCPECCSPRASRPLSNRYEHLSNEIFLLDTAKGAVWQLVQFPELKTKPRGWQPILTVETPAAYEALAKRYGKTSETPPQP